MALGLNIFFRPTAGEIRHCQLSIWAGVGELIVNAHIAGRADV